MTKISFEMAKLSFKEIENWKEKLNTLDDDIRMIKNEKVFEIMSPSPSLYKVRLVGSSDDINKIQNLDLANEFRNETIKYLEKTKEIIQKCIKIQERIIDEL